MSTTASVSEVAGQLRSMFLERPQARARVRSSRVVHAVVMGSWLGEQAVEPMCRVAVGGWNPLVLTPTYDPVTCARCLRMIQAGQGIGAGETGMQQLCLFP